MFVRLQLLILTLVMVASCPATALAGERDFFVGLDVSLGTASGSSRTADGGAPFAGGGIVNDVKFGETTGIGGHIGYRLDPAIAVFLSYQHVRGDIGWNATFPLFGVASEFEGAAISNIVMGNIAYKLPLSSVAAVRATAGVGLTVNTLSGIVETDKATGIFLADVKNNSRTHPVAQIGAGIQYEIMSNVALGIDASFAYSGGFETGNTRSGNLGVTDINPYKVNDVWRANAGASIRVGF